MNDPYNDDSQLDDSPYEDPDAIAEDEDALEDLAHDFPDLDLEEGDLKENESTKDE